MRRVVKATTLEAPKSRSHEALVKRAARWLEACRCRLVLTGQQLKTNEQPDVFAWNDAYETVLVEVKTSRADFLADAKKQFRQAPELGMGKRRWYFAPPGIIHPQELPLDWGLAEPRNGYVARVVTPTPQRHNKHAEQRLLFHLCVEQKRALDHLWRAWRRDGR